MTTTRNIVYQVSLAADPNNQSAAQAIANQIRSNATEQIRATETAQRAIRRDTDERLRLIREEERERERAYRSAEREYDRAMRSFQVNTDRAHQASLKLNQQVMGIGGAALRAARGFAMLGASGDKDLQKVIEKLLVVQGLFDVFQGYMQVVMGVAKAYDTLTKGIRAAAAAQVALNTAQAAGSVMAGGGAVSVGGAAAGGAAGFAGLTAAMLNPLTLIITGIIAAITLAVSKTARSAVGSGLHSGFDWTVDQFGGDSWRSRERASNKLEGRQLASMTNRLSMEERAGAMLGARYEGENDIRQARMQQALAGGGVAGARAAGGIVDAELAAVRSAPERSSNLLSERLANLQQEIKLINEKKSIHEQILALQKQETQEAMSRAREELSSLKERQREAKETVDQLAKSRMSAEERYALASVDERRMLDSASAKAARGETLTPEELKALGGFKGFAGVDQIYGMQIASRADKLGFGEFATGLGYDPAQEAEARDRLAKIEAEVVLKQEIILQLEGGAESFAAEMAEAMRGLATELVTASQAAVEAQMGKQNQDDLLKGAASRAAARAGE